MTTRREADALEKLARAKVKSADAEAKLYEAMGNRFLGKAKTGERTLPVLPKNPKSSALK